jgi:hypothetical protein
MSAQRMAADIGENEPRQSVVQGDFGERKIEHRFAGELVKVEGRRLKISIWTSSH